MSLLNSLANRVGPRPGKADDDAALAELRARVAELEGRLDDLAAQLRESREDNRRVTELYDVVINRLREDNPLRVPR